MIEATASRATAGLRAAKQGQAAVVVLAMLAVVLARAETNSSMLYAATSARRLGASETAPDLGGCEEDSLPSAMGAGKSAPFRYAVSLGFSY